MDQAAAFLAALRAAQYLGGAPLPVARIEARARILNLHPETLPPLMATLQREGAVILLWGGEVEVLPDRASGVPNQTVNVSGGFVQVAGRDAHAGSVTTGQALPLGELVAALERL